MAKKPYRRRSDPNYKPDYKEYLKTGAWRMKRNYVLSKRGYKCEECGTTTPPIQVHHLTYKRIFHERLSDFKVLCRKCHENVHNINKWDDFEDRIIAKNNPGNLSIVSDTNNAVLETKSDEILHKRRWIYRLWKYLKKLAGI